jgi:ABC-type glycerol-3-phosphate transport system permease component
VEAVDVTAAEMTTGTDARPTAPWPTAPLRWARAHGASIGLVIVTLGFVLPFLWVITNSLEPLSVQQSGTAHLLPAHPTFENFVRLIADDHFYTYIFHSLIVASLCTAITLVLGSLAGYALARLPVRGRVWIIGFIVLVGFFPVTAMLGPMFRLWTQLHLLNLVGAGFSDLIYTLPLTTVLLASLFSQLPAEIEEAAMADGCSRLGALWRVVIPLAAPAMATAGIFSFIFAWSDFAFSLTFLQSSGNYTAPLAVQQAGSYAKYATDYGTVDAATLVTALPILVLVLFAQRRIVTGLTAGAVK